MDSLKPTKIVNVENKCLICGSTDLQVRALSYNTPKRKIKVRCQFCESEYTCSIEKGKGVILHEIKRGKIDINKRKKTINLSNPQTPNVNYHLEKKKIKLPEIVEKKAYTLQDICDAYFEGFIKGIDTQIKDRY